MNIGVCGTGTVASWISDIIQQLNNKDIVLYTCATSPGFDCEEFSAKYGYVKTSPSFDQLMDDPDVDLVYIAVPNNMHFDLCMKAIVRGKNVVCEKPFSVRESECVQVFEAAREKGVFVSEALWPLFLPAHKMIDEEIASGAIGEVVSGSIIMLDNVMFLERVKHLETGGGVMLDEGPYALGFLVRHFGTDIKSVDSVSRKLDTGVDAAHEITVTYNDGKVVTIRQAMDTPREEHTQYAEIVGTKGKIWVDQVSNPDHVKIMDLDGNVLRELALPERIRFRGMPPVSGYEYEWLGFERALSQGKKECPEIPWANSILISHIMTAVLKNAGVEYPF